MAVDLVWLVKTQTSHNNSTIMSLMEDTFNVRE